MNISQRVLKLAGWKVDITAPRRDKCVICVAPHTSNWDFIIGLLAYKSIGRKADFLMKDFWFFFPLKYLLYSLGGIPVKRSSNNSLTTSIAERFNTSKRLNVAITPEGTRSLNPSWRSGFIRIAHLANVPIQLGVIDYADKIVIIKDEYFTTGNTEYDMERIKSYYADFKEKAKFPQKFST